MGGDGGEVTGVRGSALGEPTPYGMVLIERGSMQLGPNADDSTWNIKAQANGASVESFWMDETEVSNAKYRQFVYWVRDSIIRERLADPAYGGDEEFKSRKTKKETLSSLILTGKSLFRGETLRKTSSAPFRASIS